MSEWQVDENGKRYRDFGKIREYEMMVNIGGIDVPESKVAEYNERMKAQTEARLKAEREKAALQSKKQCPFMQGINTFCSMEACALYDGSRCVFTGVKATRDTKGKKCPIKHGGKCAEECAFYNGGCAIPEIINHVKEK